jgi:hypothetical protein
LVRRELRRARTWWRSTPPTARCGGKPVIAGASIVGDTIYWGSGYSNLPLPGFVANNKFYAFSVNGK